jgi:hypothetical protein
MHAHSIQPNPYATIDALRSAQRTAAKREAESVRQELMESASELAGDSEVSDAYVARLEGQTDERRSPKRRNQKEQSRQKQQDSADLEEPGRHLSDWA